MLQARLRNIDDDFIEELLITDPNPLSNDSKFSKNGVFSEAIFGNLSNAVGYSCDCGKFQGEFNVNYECPECNSKVVYKNTHISKEGWIDLQYPVIHPVIYRYLKKIIGPTALLNIIHFKSKITLEGFVKEVPIEAPYYEIGMGAFIEHFDEIFTYYCNKKLKLDSSGNKRKKRKEVPAVDKDSNIHRDIAFIRDNIEIMFITTFPVINSRLRPATMVGNEFSFDETNNIYNNIIKNSKVISEMSDVENTDTNVLPLVFKTQTLVNDLFNKIILNLSSKEGFIRGSLLGCRVNFSARNVIAPLSGEYSMDECAIPYRTAVELMRPIIIRKLQKLKNISLVQANRIWFDGSRVFNKTIHNIMMETIRLDTIRILLNRNPTM